MHDSNRLKKCMGEYFWDVIAALYYTYIRIYFHSHDRHQKWGFPVWWTAPNLIFSNYTFSTYFVHRIQKS